MYIRCRPGEEFEFHLIVFAIEYNTPARIRIDGGETISESQQPGIYTP